MSASEAKEITLTILDQLFSPDAQAVAVRLWDGTLWPDEAPRPTTLVLNHPGALRTAFLPATELAMGEAYVYDDLDIEGNIEAIFGLADRLSTNLPGLLKKLRLASALLSLPDERRPRTIDRGRAELSGHRHSVERDRQAVTYHYNVSNEFYALWLDRALVYSCAYFSSPDDGLDAAQERKLDYICRKLRLKPGQRLLDIGCGWGGLVLHAAKQYGVDATGITLSQPQADLANERIAQAGLAERARVAVRDYREVHEPAGYDALVSVGMFEHVGQALLPEYFARTRELLKPAGVFLNHGIALRATNPPEKGRSFSDAYVFPDGEMVAINTTTHAAEECGLEVRDIESLREHYALTLRHWVRRLEAHHAEAAGLVGEPTYRVWRLYMAGSAYHFTAGAINVYQTLFVKPDERGRSNLPLTRADWYCTI